MAIVQKSFNLDIVPGYAPPVISVSEYDIGRSYEVTLLNDGAAFTIPTGTTASIEGTLEDYVEHSIRVKRSIFNADNLTIENNKIYFELNENMTPFSGEVWCKIRLTKDNKPISTCGFIMEVDRAGVNSTDIPQAEGFEEQLRRAIATQLPAAISDVLLDYIHGYSGPDQMAIDAIKLAAHPVGSYYWSDDSTNPGSIFGGVWEAVTDVFLFAASSTIQVGDTGGSKTHTLTLNEMPSHEHDGLRYGANEIAGNLSLNAGTTSYKLQYSGSSGTSNKELHTGASGNGEAFSVMPPYLATYCWRRTA